MASRLKPAAGTTPQDLEDMDLNLDDIETEPYPDDGEPEPEPEPEPDPADDEPADDDQDEEPEPEPEPEPAPRARARANGEGDDGESRGVRRVQRLANENRELRAQQKALMDRFDQFLSNSQGGRQPAPVEPQETPQQRQQRRELMTPEERMSEDFQALRTELGGTFHQTRMQLADQTDKSAFDSKWGNTAVYKRHSARVEQELATMRRNNQNASREVILAFLIGNNALSKFLAEGGKQRQAAETRVRRQTTKPGNPGSDATRTRQRTQSSLEDRLANVKL